MKKVNLLKAIVLALFMYSFSGCSDDDPKSGCYQEDNRKIVATLKDVTGAIRQPIDGCQATILLDEPLESFPLGLLAPCNLAEEFQIESTQVVLSGHIYESFETEDICADFFEITAIRFSNP